MSIELEPSSQLAFRRPLTESIKETLIIRNPTQLPIAFKVKTTAPKQYCVRPNSGLVGPGQELEVQVQMQAMKEDPPADFKCKDKFLVQSIAITAERQNLEPNELWPAMERVAKDQIKEKKIRCAFLPPIEHAITQIKEEDESSSHLSSAASSVHLQHQSVAGAAPSSPVQITQTTSTTSTTTVSFQQAAENRNSTISTSSVTSSYSASSSTDSKALQRELDNARETIQQLQMTMEKLQKEANMLRQRKPESGSGSAPTMTAVTLKHSQEGLYPAVYILGAVLIAFLFSLFF